MKLQRLQTTNLFYNRYVYKLRVKNKIGSIFRGMNLGFAKSKIDEMQRHAESETVIPSPYNNIRRKENVSIETFMDTFTLYNALEKNKNKCERQNRTLITRAMKRVSHYSIDSFFNPKGAFFFVF